MTAVQVQTDYKALFESNTGDVSVNHRSGSFRVIGALLDFKCPSLRKDIRERSASKSGPTLDLSAYSEIVVRALFTHFYYGESIDLDAMDFTSWFELYHLGRKNAIQIAECLCQNVDQTLPVLGRAKEVKTFLADAKKEISTEVKTEISSHIRPVSETSTKILLSDFILRRVKLECSPISRSCPYDMLLLAFEIKQAQAKSADLAALVSTELFDVLLQTVVPRLRQRMARRCFDSLRPGKDGRPLNYIRFTCCEHSFPAPKTDSACFLEEVGSYQLAHNGKPICYNFNFNRMGESSDALQSNQDKVETSLCCRHDPLMREVDKFKKLPLPLRKIIVKELVPKELLEGLDDEIMDCDFVRVIG